MKWISSCSVLMLAIAGLMTGCASTGGVSAPLSEGNLDRARSPAVAEMRYLNIAVQGKGINEDGAVVAGELERAIRQTLSDYGIPMKTDQPDLLLTLDVEAVPFDESGNYFLYEGTVKATAKVVSREPRDLGLKTFKVRSERKLGKADALLSLANRMSTEAIEWSKEMTSPSRCSLFANDITVEVPWYKTRKAQVDYAQNFVKEVSSYPGVTVCRLVEHDYANKVLVFRIVYLRDSYPSGLLNYLASKDTLNIKPKK